MKIVKSLKESGLLIKGISEAIENETKKQKGEPVGTLAASLLGNMLAGKGAIWVGKGTIMMDMVFDAALSCN